MQPLPQSAAAGPSDIPFDLLTPLLNWVENRAAPTKVTATQANAGTVVRTRPVFPYPLVARYTGTGDINDASNFAAATPEPHLDRLVYVGKAWGAIRWLHPYLFDREVDWDGALVAAIRVARGLREGCVVTVFPDFGDKYLSTNLWIGWEQWRKERLQKLVSKWNASASATT